MNAPDALGRLSVPNGIAGYREHSRAIGRWSMAVALLAVIAADPVAAQSAGEAFCETKLAETIKNLFAVIQFGGPLLGGVLAMGATVALPVVPRADKKKELKQIRTQGLIWGVIVAPLGTTIIQFLMNHIVAGGVSCGF